MLLEAEKQKIQDFQEAYRRIINPKQEKEMDDIIDALFQNVVMYYETFCKTVPFISAYQEAYDYHILQPVNGRYSLLDFLLNRAISNIDGIVPGDKNEYNRRKVLSIDTKRYKDVQGDYPAEFIQKQYQKSKFHETGHALFIWDTKPDHATHSSSGQPGVVNFAGFWEKAKGFEAMLGQKYPNLLASKQIAGAIQLSHTSVSKGFAFGSRQREEIANEYFATKFAGLYQEQKHFGAACITTKPSVMAVMVPDRFNSYSIGTRFFYHLENLVSSQAMFESLFFESDKALREFSQKFEEPITQVWESKEGKKPSKITEPYARFQNLMDIVCMTRTNQAPENVQQSVKILHQLTDWVFAMAYRQELAKGQFPVSKIEEMMQMAYSLSPIMYQEEKQEWVASPIKDWYHETCQMIRKRKNARGTNNRRNWKR